jgi:hypothetical protein
MVWFTGGLVFKPSLWATARDTVSVIDHVPRRSRQAVSDIELFQGTFARRPPRTSELNLWHKSCVAAGIKIAYRDRSPSVLWNLVRMHRSCGVTRQLDGL